jgi:hypothetical protein
MARTMLNYKANFKILDKDIELSTDSRKACDSIVRQFNFFLTEKNTCTPIKIEILSARGLSGFITRFFMPVMAILRRDDYVMFHGAALVKNGKAKLFLGPTQSGKTTISLFSTLNGYKLLSDDICVVNKKNLTIAPFIKIPVSIHSSVVRFFEEYNIPIYNQARSRLKKSITFNDDEEIGFELRDLQKMGICFADEKYPIEKIYIFRNNNEKSILPLLPPLCYLWHFRKPDEVMEDLKFLYYLLDNYFYNSIPSLKLNTVTQRKHTYNRIRELLELK